MESIDLLVLRTARDWLQAGHRVLLATVAHTWGSSPRPVGSMMALRAGPPQQVRYGVSADEAHRFGLPCGGTLELILEFSPCWQSLSHLLERLDSGHLVRRQVALHDGEATLLVTATPEQFSCDGQYLVNTLGPGYRLLLIGAGALAEYLATMALFNGFRVSVCDPRPEYIAGWNVAGVDCRVGMPDDVVRDFAADLRTCIVAVSHDPKLDDLALLEALQGPAF